MKYLALAFLLLPLVQLGSSGDPDTLDISKQYKAILTALKEGKPTCYKEQMIHTRDLLKTLYDLFGEKCAQTKSSHCIAVLYELLYEHVVKMVDVVLEVNCADNVYIPILRALFSGVSHFQNHNHDAIIAFGSDRSIIDATKPDESNQIASDAFNLVAVYKDVTKALVDNKHTCYREQLIETQKFLESFHQWYGQNCTRTKSNECIPRLIQSLHEHTKNMTDYVLESNCADNVYIPILQTLLRGLKLSSTHLAPVLIAFGLDKSMNIDKKSAQVNRNTSITFYLYGTYRDIATALGSSEKSCATSHLKNTKTFFEAMHKHLESECKSDDEEMNCERLVLGEIREHIRTSVLNMSEAGCRDQVYIPILQGLQAGLTKTETALLHEIAGFGLTYIGFYQKR